jgi:hypothetical protein
VAQNEGIRKITGVFKTTPLDPLHNLIHVPSIQYILEKLIHTYSNRLQGLPLNAKTRTILSEDQCQYWPDYIIPQTNLRRTFLFPSLTSQWVEGRDLQEAWNTPHFTYTQYPTRDTPPSHKVDFKTLHPSYTHLVISTHADTHTPYAIYHTPYSSSTVRGLDRA